MIIATILRFWGAGFGLPRIFYIDETKIVKRSKLIAGNLLHKKWDIDPQYYQYPTFLTNLLAAEYVIYALGYGIITSKTGKHANVQEAIDNLFRDANPGYVYDAYPPIFYLLARLNNAVAGVLTVLICFFLSKIAFDNDDRIGLLSAFFLSVMFLHAKHSKYPMADAILALWTIFAMVYVVKMITKGALKDYILAGLFIGLGISTKYLTVFLTASYLLNAAVNWWKNHKDEMQARRILLYTCIGLLLIPVGFLIGTPTFITRYRQYLGMAVREKRGMGSVAQGGKYGSTQTWFLDYFFNNVPSWFEPLTINSLWGAMGIPLLIIVSLAFIYFIYRGIDQKTPRRVIYWDFVLFISIFYWFIAGAGKNRIIRYFVIVAPFLTVIAGKFLVDVMDAIPYVWVKARKGILMGGVAILLVIPTSIRITKYNRLMDHTNNRIIAGEWFESHVPKGSRVWMPILYPPCVSHIDYNVKYYRGQQKTADMMPTYEILKKYGFEYVVLSSYDYGPCFSKEALKDYPEGTLAFLELYNALEKNSEWGKVFESNLTDIPGPIIRIYKIQ